MKITNEVELIYAILDYRMTTSRKVAIRLGISPQLLHSKLDRKHPEKKMSVTTAQQILNTLDYGIVFVPKYLADQLSMEEGNFKIAIGEVKTKNGK